MSIKLTPAGRAELESLISKKEQELLEFQKYKGGDAINQGDNWHDNFAFEQAVTQENAKILEIRDLKHKLATAIFIEDTPSENSSIIGIGSKFSISIYENGVLSDPENYVLSDSISPDWLSGEISINSPLGKSVLGKSEEDTISFFVNESEIKGRIISIN